MPMKRYLFVVICLIFTLTGCSTSKITPGSISINGDNTYHYQLIEDIGVFHQMVSNNQEFIIVAGQTTCGACLLYKEVLNEFILDTRVKIYYVNIDEVPGSLEALRFYGKLRTTPTTFLYQSSRENHSKILHQFGYVGDLEILRSTFAKYINIQ